MKYQAVLFDMDGTVIDSLEDIVDALNVSLQRFGMQELSLSQIRTHVGNGARRLMECVVPPGTPDPLLERMLAFYKPYYAAHSRVKTKPYGGILAMMESLKAKGIRLAIISNKPDKAVRELAAEFFPGLLELAMGEREGVRRKPWPDMIDAAAEHMDVDKYKCLYVGDSEVDIDTAKNAGIDCVSVSWGFRSREELARSGACVIIDRAEDLLRYIEAS